MPDLSEIVQFDATCEGHRDCCAFDEQPRRLTFEIKLTFFVVDDHTRSSHNVNGHDLGARCSDDKSQDRLDNSVSKSALLVNAQADPNVL